MKQNKKNHKKEIDQFINLPHEKALYRKIL